MWSPDWRWSRMKRKVGLRSELVLGSSCDPSSQEEGMVLRLAPRVRIWRLVVVLFLGVVAANEAAQISCMFFVQWEMQNHIPSHEIGEPGEQDTRTKQMIHWQDNLLCDVQNKEDLRQGWKDCACEQCEMRLLRDSWNVAATLVLGVAFRSNSIHLQDREMPAVRKSPTVFITMQGLIARSGGR